MSEGAGSTISRLKDVGAKSGRGHCSNSTEIVVQVVTLGDTLGAAGVERVHLVRVDVEGTEWRVLQGTRWY